MFIQYGHKAFLRRINPVMAAMPGPPGRNPHAGTATIRVDMKRSAGLLMFRRVGSDLQVLLAHPGGPFWQRRDAGAWSIPKGEYEEPEAAIDAAQREFSEETGFPVVPPLLALGEVIQASAKRITAWAFEADADPAALRCNEFELEWPPRSGRRRRFPEIDRVAWFPLDEAREKLVPAQRELLERLQRALAD
jgi:predicted NUDIX family NTP pyrophosphohydrolase